MATKFDFKKSPDVNGTADKTTLYPKIVVAGTKNLENIADDIAKRSGFKAGTVIGLFSDLENLLTDYLADGYNVKLGEIGTFSATTFPLLSLGTFFFTFIISSRKRLFKLWSSFRPVSCFK